MTRSLPRLAAALLASLAAVTAPAMSHAEFTESEDSPFLDPDGSQDDPLGNAAPVPWDGAGFAASFPSGAKLVRGSLDAGDVDAYAFSLDAGQLVLAALFEDAAGERNDTSLGLFTGGVVPPLASNDDGGSGFLSRFAFQTGSAGVYQIGVTGFGDDAWNGSHAEARSGLVPYRLVVAVTSDPPPLAETESNDSLYSANPLPPGGGVLGAVLAVGDVDYFQLTLEAGDRLAVSVFDLANGSFQSAGGERNDAIVGVFDPWGALATGGTNDDGGPGLMSNLLFTAAADGTWTIAVSGFGDDAFVGDHAEAGFPYLLVVARERACPHVASLVSGVVASTANAYETAELQEGDHYYTDRTDAGRHVLVDVPPPYRCSQWIKTANNDKNVTDPSHLSFSLAEDASVFIGYDTRATGEPVWLSSAFTPTGRVLDITDPDPSQEFDVLRRDFAAGTVVLGGNEAPGAGSNYVVFARPLPLGDPSQAFTVPATAGGVTLIVSGVPIQVARSLGETSEQLAQALADAVNADPTLAAARIYGLASGATFVTTGSIESSTIAAPLPLLPVGGVVLLVLLLAAVGYRVSGGAVARG